MKLAHLAFPLLLTACTADVATFEDDGATSGASVTSNITSHLTGCHGVASSSIPADGQYTITTFGGPGDHQSMSCGGYADGTGWYAASRQRYGCGAHLQVEANGKCAVVEAQDYGPDVCVEHAAGMPILDVSPRVSMLLFNASGAGWSDHMKITVTEVDSSTPLGECTAGSGGGSGSGSGSGSGTGSGSGSGGGSGTPTSCSSSTLDRDVDSGTCVQSSSDSSWYECESGAWVAKSSSSGCAEAYGFCYSPTLGKSVPARACVQSRSSSTWFQCNGQGWVTPVDTGAQTGPIGTCSEMDSL